MKKVGMIVLALSLVATAAFATGQAETTTADQPTVITAAYESEPGNLNTIIWPTTSDTNITHMVYDCLVVPDEQLQMVGELAESWTVSDDDRTYTFKLREGVTWHDGEPFTADDVEFTFTMMAHPDYDMGSNSRVQSIVGAAEFREGEAASVEGIEVIDDYTISFTTVEPYAPFLSDLFIGVLPKHVWSDTNPTEWAKHEANRAPIGTGPFEFVRWESGQYIELAANEDYFGGAPGADQLFVRFGDQNTLLAAFISGEIDIVPAPAAELETIESLPAAELKLGDQLVFYYIGFNVRNEHFSNEDIRIAMAHAVDKTQVVDTILGRLGEVQHDVFPNTHWSHYPNTPEFAYDPAQAAELIESAGYTKGSDGFYRKDGEILGLTLEVPTGKKEREQTAVMLKQYWEAAGIKTELRYQDFPTLVTKLLPRTKDDRQREVTAEDFDAYILGFGIEADPNEYYTYFHSETMPPNGYNFCGYANPEMDRLFDAQLTATDFERRQDIFWDISEHIVSRQVWLPLYYQKMSYASNERIGGFEADFRGLTFNAEEWYVK
jgi:peptide/nickel transport system substrate-binding protein